MKKNVKFIVVGGHTLKTAKFMLLKKKFMLLKLQNFSIQDGSSLYVQPKNSQLIEKTEE